MDVLDFFGVPCAHVLGYDWGGGIALCLAVHYPARVKRLAVFHGTYTEQRGELASIRHRVLLLWTRSDQFHPYAWATAFHKRLTGSTLVTLKSRRGRGDEHLVEAVTAAAVFFQQADGKGRGRAGPQQVADARHATSAAGAGAGAASARGGTTVTAVPQSSARDNDSKVVDDSDGGDDDDDGDRDSDDDDEEDEDSEEEPELEKQVKEEARPQAKASRPRRSRSSSATVSRHSGRGATASAVSARIARPSSAREPPPAGPRGVGVPAVAGVVARVGSGAKTVASASLSPPRTRRLVSRSPSLTRGGTRSRSRSRGGASGGYDSDGGAASGMTCGEAVAALRAAWRCGDLPRMYAAAMGRAGAAPYTVPYVTRLFRSLPLLSPATLSSPQSMVDAGLWASVPPGLRATGACTC